jgi:hypothetical protein
MMNLNEVKRNSELTSVIDWDMTPEEAVTLYLEWGNNWANGKRRIRSKNDYSVYFVVNTWDDPAQVYLIRRNSDEAEELAIIQIPEDLRKRFLDSVFHHKGVYPVNEELKSWLEKELYESPVESPICPAGTPMKGSKSPETYRCH